MFSDLKFEHLFSPFRLGRLELKNRIVMNSMSTGMTNVEGYVTEKLKDYFQARANGGVGLIIVGYACVDFPRGNTMPCRIAIDDDKFIPGLSSLVEVIKNSGARVAVQLAHAGGVALESETHLRPVAPSPVICRGNGDIPEPLTEDEIQQMVVRFAKAAERAVKAGFEGIEIHAATSYLINQFLSPITNKRTDNYGGSLKNRARFLLEIITAIKNVVGPDYPLWVKVNAMEYGMPNGIVIEDTKELVRMLEQAGCYAINVTGWGMTFRFSSMAEPFGSNVDLAYAIKKQIKIPVIVTGRMTPEIAETTLQQGKADLVAIGRALLADPEIPNKVASGRLDDIAPCLACDSCGSPPPVRCTINASLGKEREYAILPAARVKNIVVIGGGPAGMEAARVAALRGHKVTLYTRESKLGGRLKRASMIPGHHIYADLVRYMSAQVAKAGVNIELGKKVTAKLISEVKPDAVIVAAGFRLSPINWLVAGVICLLNYKKLVHTGGKIGPLRSVGEKRDTVGLQTPFLMAGQPNNEVFMELIAKVAEVHRVGDCTEPFGIMQAITDGACVGRIV